MKISSPVSVGSTTEKRMQTRSLRSFSAFSFSVLTALVCLTASPSRAALVSYDVDASLSSLSLSGTFLGQPISQQSPGSLTDFWDGTITGDLVGSTLTFSGGSAVIALGNPHAPFVPAGSGVENYGGQVVAYGAIAASRDLSFDFTAGSITHGVAPGGASTVTMLTGHSDYFVPPSTSSSSLSIGDFSQNNSASLVSISQSLGVETLTLPMMFTFSTDSGVIQTLTGTLVATRSVPEPTTAMLGAAGLGLLSMRRRRSPIEAHRG